MRAIPQVNLADFLSDDANLRQSFVKDLGKAYEEVGFVTVINHGITDEMINALFTNIQPSFALPTEAKKKYEVPGLAGQRGYTSFGKEHARGSDAPDLKEFYQWGQTVTDSDPIKAEYPDNVELAEVPAFNETMYGAYRAFEKSGSHLLRALALFLNLPEDYFA